MRQPFHYRQPWSLHPLHFFCCPPSPVRESYKGQDVLEEVAQCEGELREVLQETLPDRSIAAV